MVEMIAPTTKAADDGIVPVAITNEKMPIESSDSADHSSSEGTPAEHGAPEVLGENGEPIIIADQKRHLFAFLKRKEFYIALVIR